MTCEVKVTYHTQQAKNGPGHNDRTSYKSSSFYRGDPTANDHWDCYDCGSSVEAERRFYENHFGEHLRRQNERYLKSRHAERVMDMDKYMETHRPHESIVQIGDKDHQVPSGYLEIAREKLITRIESVGGHVISADIHFDTAHELYFALYQQLQHKENSRYVMQITGDNAVGKAQLDNSIDPGSKYPVIAVTSRLMSTGVDAQTCELVVLDRSIGSMTEFKQIIGRGTRVKEEYEVDGEQKSKMYYNRAFLLCLLIRRHLNVPAA